MIVIWQGYGYIALAAFLLPLVGCVGLIDFSNRIGILGAGVGFLVASVVCFLVGRSLTRATDRRAEEAYARRSPDELLAVGTTRNDTPHTLYWVPLWVWGWIYGLFGLLLAGGSVVGIAVKGWKN
jgi:hypothetical protein